MAGMVRHLSCGAVVFSGVVAFCSMALWKPCTKCELFGVNANEGRRQKKLMQNEHVWT